MAQKLTPLLLVPLLLGWHWFEPAARRNQKGIAAFRQEQYAAALEHFLSAKGLKPEADVLKNNIAVALYGLRKFQQAAGELASIDPGGLGDGAAVLHYNLGNALYRMGQYGEALESYRRSLRLAPDDVACKKNFELTLKKLREQQSLPEAQEPPAPQPQKHEAVMQFLDQQEKKQMEKRKRQLAPAGNEKDW